MKETYLSPETLAGKTREMIRRVEQYAGGRRKLLFTPEKSALLVLDMQSYFLDASSHAFVPSARAIIPHVQSLVRAFAAEKLPVILTRHINSLQDAGMMARWWSELITEDNPLSIIDPEISTPQAVAINKSRYDAFCNTRLENMLRDKGIERVVICGLLTHLCCETTARSAFMRGFEVFFAADGTATYNEQFHCAALLSLAHGFAALVTVRELLAALTGDGDG